MNLQNNKLSSLPKHKMLEFFQNGGELGEYSMSGGNCLDVRRNPLSYPPAGKIEEGQNAVREYLEKYDDNMINAEDLAVILIGHQNAGKTSLGLCLSGQISEAAEIKAGDRTQAFDVYPGTVKGTTVNFIDVGGQKEYRPSFSLVGRDGGLYLCTINPSDLESMKTMDAAVGSWIEITLDGTISPNFLFDVSKMDTIPNEGKKKWIKRSRKKLKKYLQKQLAKVEKTRMKREDEQKKEVEKNRLKQEKNRAEGQSTADLEAEGRILQEQLDDAIYKRKNLPNFHMDRICFVSSTKSREGYDELEENLAYCISNLNNIKIQQHWQEKSDWLFTKYANQKYIRFDELLIESGMDKADLIEMLKSLNFMGRIIWSDDPMRREFVFHNLEILSTIAKSIFYHEMANEILPRFAELKGIYLKTLKECHEQGQLPLDLIRALFFHISNNTSGIGKKIDYSHLQLSPSEESDDAIDSSLAALEKLNIVKPMNAKVKGMKMYFIPQSIFQTPGQLTQKEWIKKHVEGNPKFELWLRIESETGFGNNTFSKCCALSMEFMGKLEDMKVGKLSYDSIDNAL